MKKEMDSQWEEMDLDFNIEEVESVVAPGVGDRQPPVTTSIVSVCVCH
jgi:hypothetical protein